MMCHFMPFNFFNGTNILLSTKLVLLTQPSELRRQVINYFSCSNAHRDLSFSSLYLIFFHVPSLSLLHLQNFTLSLLFFPSKTLFPFLLTPFSCSPSPTQTLPTPLQFAFLFPVLFCFCLFFIYCVCMWLGQVKVVAGCH